MVKMILESKIAGKGSLSLAKAVFGGEFRETKWRIVGDLVYGTEEYGSLPDALERFNKVVYNACI